MCTACKAVVRWRKEGAAARAKHRRGCSGASVLHEFALESLQGHDPRTTCCVLQSAARKSEEWESAARRHVGVVQ